MRTHHVPNAVVDLGVTTPANEDCAQVGTADYYDRARREGRALIDFIRRTIGPEPDGARLTMKSHPHDFGDYLTVVCQYDDGNEAASNYAWLCDEKLPEEWDDVARRTLEGVIVPPDLQPERSSS